MTHITKNYEFVSEIFEISTEMIVILTETFEILLEIFDFSTEMLEDRNV